MTLRHRVALVIFAAALGAAFTLVLVQRRGREHVPEAAHAAAVASAPMTVQSAPLPPLPPNARTDDERNTIAVFARMAASCVYVTQHQIVVDYWAGGGEHEVPAGSGSGFVWDERGHIVTNFHVVANARHLTVTLHDQRTFPARIVGSEPRKDIAVVKIDAPPGALTPIARHEEKVELDVGQKVIAIGNPFGLDQTLTTGIISALGRQVDGIGGVKIREMIQTDAAINPGNSGGPLLDSSGRLIGMNTMIYSKSGASAGIGFAVPATTIARVVPQLIKLGHVEQVGMGIDIDPQRKLERRFRIRGVVILGVRPDGPAAAAGLTGLRRTYDGLELGDVIVGIDDKPINDYDDLYSILDTKKAGDTIRVKVSRQGRERVEVPIKLVTLA